MNQQSTLQGQGLLIKPLISAIPAALLALIMMFACIALWPGMTGPLVHDDHRNLAPLMADKPSYRTAILENQGGPLGRPVTMLSFALQRVLGDSLEIREMKLFNLAIHLFNALLVYLLLANIFRIAGNQGPAAFLSLAATALWTLNPVNTETVLYVIQRATLLATMFMLVACLAYIHIRCSIRRIGPSAPGWSLALMSCWVLAIFSKENGLVLPLVLLFIEVCLFDTLKTAVLVRRGALLALPLGVASLFYLQHAGYIDYSARSYTMQERLLTQSGVIFHYLRESFLPLFTETGIFRDDVATQKRLFEIKPLLSIFLIAGFLLLALLNIRKPARLLALGILFFFMAHTLESTIIPLEMFYRHRNYFPSIGIVLAVTACLYLLAWPKINPGLGSLVLCVYLAFLVHASFYQSRTWSSYDAILLNAYKHHPYSVRLNLEMSGRLARQGDINTALQVNGAIINARPVFSMPLKIQRYYLYCELGQGMPAVEYQLLKNDINLFKPHLTSNAMDIFLTTYQDRRCDFIDLGKILDPLLSWADARRVDGSLAVAQLWNLDYYLVRMLVMLDREKEAMERLQLLASAGGKGAEYLLSDPGKTDKIFQKY